MYTNIHKQIFILFELRVLLLGPQTPKIRDQHRCFGSVGLVLGHLGILDVILLLQEGKLEVIRKKKLSGGEGEEKEWEWLPR